MDEFSITDKKIYQYFKFEPDFELVEKFGLEYYESARLAIHDVLTECVVERLDADRPIGAFCSGGVDSGVVCAIASRHVEKLRTYAIGMPEATDLEFVDATVKHLDTSHSTYMETEMGLLDFVEETIRQIGSYDTTTVRATTCQLKCSLHIANTTDTKVLLSGDGSDEALGGYMENHICPSEEEFRLNQIKRLCEIHNYDGLRVDRGVSVNGLEVRTPYLDKRFVKLCLSIPVRHLMPKDGIEKYILRDAFRDYLPENIMFRPKEAFSDGVSSQKRSWFQMTQERAMLMYPHWEQLITVYEHNQPYSPESLYYRILFERFYGSHHSVGQTIPAFWVQSWTGEKEPSARIMQIYQQRTEV